MATTTGKDGSVLVASNEIACMESWTIDENVEIANAKCMKEGFTRKAVSDPDWTGSMVIVSDPTDTLGQGALVIGAELACAFREVNDTTGSPEDTGTIIINSISKPVSSTEFNKRTVAFTGNSVLVHGTVA